MNVEDLEKAIAYAREFHPHLLEEDALSDYMNKINVQLDEAGYHGMDINELLECRDIVQGHEMYLNDKLPNYMEARDKQHCLYLEAKAEVASKASSAPKGKIESDKVELSLKSDYISSCSIYKRIEKAAGSLHSKDKLLSQRISFLKEEKNRNQFINGQQ